MAKTLLTNEQSVWYGKDSFNKVSHELFGRPKTLVTNYRMRTLFGRAKNL